MAGTIHRYGAALEWRGNQGNGTRRHDGYGRRFEARIDGKPLLAGSADPAFRGDPELHNPEDLLLIALSSCHMLSYLALCAREGIAVTAYDDRAEGVMQTDASGGGRFTGVVLQPRVTIGDAGQLARARELHATAHAVCYIASSCNFPVEHRVSVSIEAADTSVPASEQTPCKDLTIMRDDRPGALARMGEALGQAGISVEGGGAWVLGGQGIAHFLVEDGEAARSALAAAGIRVLAVHDVLIQRLHQDRPGQLGGLCQRMADAGVNIEALYSDHANQLVLLVDDPETGRRVSEAWMWDSGM